MRCVEVEISQGKCAFAIANQIGSQHCDAAVNDVAQGLVIRSLQAVMSQRKVARDSMCRFWRCHKMGRNTPGQGRRQGGEIKICPDVAVEQQEGGVAKQFVGVSDTAAGFKQLRLFGIDNVEPEAFAIAKLPLDVICLLYTSPSPRDKRQSRMPSSA